MNSKKIFVLLSIVCAVLVISFSLAVYGAGSIFSNYSTDLLRLKTEKESLKIRTKNMVKAKENIEEFSGLYEKSKQIIPENKDQASLIGEITSIAGSVNIHIGSIDFPKSTLGTPLKNKGSSSDKSQLTEMDKIKGVYAMEINISNDESNPVTYAEIINFLKLLENSRKTAQVTNVSVLPTENASSLFNFRISINTYVRPNND